MRGRKRDGTYSADSSFSARKVITCPTAASSASGSRASLAHGMSRVASHCPLTAWS